MCELTLKLLIDHRAELKVGVGYVSMLQSFSYHFIHKLSEVYVCETYTTVRSSYKLIGSPAAGLPDNLWHHMWCPPPPNILYMSCLVPLATIGPQQHMCACENVNKHASFLNGMQSYI